jgi:hypothetical protein
MEKRNVQLSNGSTLEIEASERFYEAIRFEYKLDKSVEITDDHIRTFVYGTVNTAVQNAEKQLILGD